MRNRPGWLACLVAVALWCAGCRRTPPPPPARFERLAPEATGVAFANMLPERAEFNILNYLYYYNGGGVAAGDVNGDGLPDLYLTSNLGKNRLYLNRGGFKFDDVTDRAGVGDSVGWKSGVTMADVNGDGWLDLYVSGVSSGAVRGRNVLYINDGAPSLRSGQAPTFTDRTKEFGLEYEGYSTQATFFDYDGDGDLDALLLRHSTHAARASGAPPRDVNAPLGGARLLENRGGRFVDVSAQAGIFAGTDGFGLGVAVSDVNGDGCPDVYVANDFQENDFLYVNDCRGKFTESIARATGHTSRFSMGVDAADFDNDLRPDLFVADMFPSREDILKSSASTETYALFRLRLRAGYHPQYARNVLQRNEGADSAPGATPRFAEVGLMAGVDATDWSWAPLFADLDDDGRKDLFVTSGVYRRPNDLDYIAYVGNDAVQATLGDTIRAANLAILERMPKVPVPSRAFRNEGGFGFADVGDAWGLGEPGFANGAAYADLDNDGRLDLVVNRVNAPAAIYRNRGANSGNHLTVVLRGAGANTQGVGAKVYVTAGGVTQLVEQSPTRGFQSSVDPRPHFGLGAAARVDSLVVVWPDRRFQVLRGVAPNGTVTVWQDSAAGRWAPPRAAPTFRFADAGRRVAFDWRHEENDANELDRDPLIPHALSTEGPALAAGDVNGDGLDDLYVGGAKWQPGVLALQRADGTFAPVDVPAIRADSVAEDVDAAFFDADGDGDLDLVVASGGNEFWGDADALRPRLYLNDGRGAFTRGELPPLFENASCVVPGDFDGDGDQDLFVGARAVSRRYGETPTSHLLRNVGGGRFEDATAAAAPALGTVGMVTAAAWADLDGDARPELVVVGEWMPVTVFRLDGGKLADATARVGLAGTEGWWHAVQAVDLTGDGRPELVLGNHGLNAYVKASAREPARMYLYDFARAGTPQPILTFYKHGTSYPIAGRDELLKAVPALREKFPSYSAFGAATVEQIFPASDLRAATVREARTFASAVAVNDGAGRFTLQPLPAAAQLAPMFASVARDFDGDGTTDLLMGGNFFAAPPILGRYDATRGVLLRGLGGGRFEAVDAARGAPTIDGQVRRMRVVRGPGGRELIVVARNDDTLLVLEPARRAAAVAAAPRHEQ